MASMLAIGPAPFAGSMDSRSLRRLWANQSHHLLLRRPFDPVAEEVEWTVAEWSCPLCGFVAINVSPAPAIVPGAFQRGFGVFLVSRG